MIPGKNTGTGIGVVHVPIFNVCDLLVVCVKSEVRTDLCAGCGKGAGGADRDEAGDGAVHEDAGERHL